MGAARERPLGERMMFGYVPPVTRMAMSSPRPHAGVITPIARAFPPRRLRTGADALVASVTSGTPRVATRGLILDLDDTLYPRERFVRSGLAAVAQHVSACFGVAADAAYGIMTRALATAGNGCELQALCDRFHLSRAIIPELVAVFRAHTPSLFLSHEVAHTLTRLRAGGWALAIVTNGLPSVQFRKVVALGLAPLVDEVIYAEEHAPGGKPCAAPFQAALRSLELSPARCISVGDDLARDIHAAKALGMATIRVARPDSSGAASDEADVVIDALRQLPDAVALLAGTAERFLSPPKPSAKAEGPPRRDRVAAHVA